MSKKLKHIISSDQFLDEAMVRSIFQRAAEFKAMRPSDYPKTLKDRLVATLFYEPSTRTRLSFEAAAEMLGASLLSTESAGVYSSAAKGETIEDTIRTIQGYADAIVLRYHTEGGARIAAGVSSVPIINAGDGPGEHPTQALLDLFTIREYKKKVDGLTIGLVGDLKNGRTVHSLALLLAGLHKVNIVAIAPEQLQLQPNYAPHGLLHTDSLEKVIGKLDVIYMTRVQKERFASTDEYEAMKNFYVLDGSLMQKAKTDAIVMHPLPRVGEIAVDVDSDSRAIYFEQARNGLFVRMALLEMLIGK